MRFPTIGWLRGALLFSPVLLQDPSTQGFILDRKEPKDGSERCSPLGSSAFIEVLQMDIYPVTNDGAKVVVVDLFGGPRNTENPLGEQLAGKAEGLGEGHLKVDF